jgi:capsular polysaccharide transport system permease protein
MELIQALNVQGRVISALILRETRSRYGNSKLGFFWALFEPFAHIATFMLIFTAMSRGVPIGDSMGVFILTGIIPWLLFSNIVSAVMGGIDGNQSLLGYPQVMPMDITISRVVLETATLVIVFCFFLIVFVNLGFRIEIDDLLSMLSAAGIMIILGTGVGMINAAIKFYFPSYANIYSAFSRPFYFMSGIFFTADFLTPDLLKLIAWNPMLHIVEWFRSGFYTSFNSTFYDVPYVINVTLAIFIIGLMAERATRKRARQI